MKTLRTKRSLKTQLEGLEKTFQKVVSLCIIIASNNKSISLSFFTNSVQKPIGWGWARQVSTESRRPTRVMKVCLPRALWGASAAYSPLSKTESHKSRQTQAKANLEVNGEGFLADAVGKNPPANAGDTSLDPWPGKIPHTTGQLSVHATTPELQF